MKRAKIIFVILWMTWFIAGMATAQVYKWVDEKGVIHLSDQPPQRNQSIGEIEAIPNHHRTTQSARNPADETWKPNRKSYELSHAAKKANSRNIPKVELFTTSWCLYCKHARNFFLSRGIPFVEYDIEKDKNAARRKKQLDTRKGIPFAVINGQRIHGFSEAAYSRALAPIR